nr:hypothetical protein [Tanacetum cinerariifolium]
YVEALPHDSEFVSLEVEKIVIPEDEEIEDDNLREKILKVDLLISKIEEFKDNPTPSSEFLTKSSSTSSKSVLEETTTFHNSLPEFENFCFDLEKISSGSTTTHSDISLLEYEAFTFYDDLIEEIRSGSTTTQSDISLPEYDLFIFDLSNDQFPPTDRSAFTHEGFGDEPGHIISPPEYDCFYFRDLPNSALDDNPTPSFDCKTKSSSTSLNSLLEETSTFHNSLPEFENFYDHIKEISSGSPTTHSDISLSDYQAFSFDDDHIKEISSGSPTTHSDISLSEYDSFIFDLTREEFVDELAHIISPPEYDCFYFRDLPDPGELMDFPDPGELMYVLNSGIRENLSTTLVNLSIEDDHSPFLAYVVWIFVAYLMYPVIPPYLHPFGNEDT